MTIPSRLVAVAAGGAVGAALRWAAGVVGPTPADGVPWGTFAANTAGCLLLGLVVALAARGRAVRTLPFLAGGLAGSLTTMSGFVVELVDLADAGHAGTAATYLGLTLLAGGAAALAGQRAARRWPA